ncbi:MAG: hypothetical protein KKA05_06755, partial [Alphaproteobacteria bacterium]|nr:hypothetical protein [Alphaproteobacteria bacterium]
AARHVVRTPVLKEFDRHAEYSKELEPADALLWARALRGHAVNIELAQAYTMAGQNFDDPVWQDVEQGSVSAYARLFRETFQQTNDVNAAHTLVLNQSLVNMNDIARDADFIKWYDHYLHPHSEMTLSPCLTFDGDLDMCMSSKTVDPAATTASRKIEAANLIELSGAMLGAPYLNQTSATQMAARADELTVAPAISVDLTTMYSNAEACCGENRTRSGGGPRIGFGMGRGGFGIAF